MKNAKKYNVICLSFMNWSNMWKRNQSMMAEMVKFDFVNRLIFVNPHFSLRKIFFRKQIYNDTSPGATKKFYPFKRTSKMWEYTPFHVIPFKYRFSIFQRIEVQLILRIIMHINGNTPYILFMNCPNIFSHYLLSELLRNSELSIFDFSDDFIELSLRKQTRALYFNNITKGAQAADIVLTVNEHLKNKYGFLNKNIHVIRNATHYNNFCRKDYIPIEFLEKIKNKKQPIIGYTGWIHGGRIDSDLLAALLEKRPNWQYVFIGPANIDFIRNYLLYKNFHYIPAVDYQRLPDYMRYFDVAVVPFKINDHTKGNDLLKFHDYLAMGKAIVSTAIGGAEELRDVIRVAIGPSDFLEQLEEALIPSNSDDILKRKKAALKNSWPERIKELEGLIRSRLEI